MQAAPEEIYDESGTLIARSLHCYVVFHDHAGACLAKRSLAPKANQPHNALRVRFAKPSCLVPACTPAFRAFMSAQWSQAGGAAKNCSDMKKPSCKVNALFISKLHQHITNARLTALFGKYGSMIACEVGGMQKKVLFRGEEETHCIHSWQQVN